MRRTLRDFRLSRGPAALGLCSTDTPGILKTLNEAQERLVEINKNEGWWGTNLAMVFTANNGLITTPRAVARITDLAVCGSAINVQNGFFELLSGGIGIQPNCASPCGPIQAYDRGIFPTMRDIDPANQLVRIYQTDVRDAGKRLLVQGTDVNGLPVYSQDGNNQVLGQYLTIQAPFATLPFVLTTITGIERDQTFGMTPIYQVDATTGVEVLLSRFQPDEVLPSYHRYFLNNIPIRCCNAPNPVQITGRVKLEFVPAQIDTDWLMIDSIPALICECESLRFASMETAEAQQLSVKKHRDACALLNNKLDTYSSRKLPSIGVLNAEADSFCRHRIGSMR